MFAILLQDFSAATLRFQLELGTADNAALLGGKCVSCHTNSVNSTLAAEGEDSKLNIYIYFKWTYLDFIEHNNNNALSILIAES